MYIGQYTSTNKLSYSSIAMLCEADLPRLQPPQLQSRHRCSTARVLCQLRSSSRPATAPSTVSSDLPGSARPPPAPVLPRAAAAPLPGSARPQSAPVLPPPLLCLGPLVRRQLQSSCSAAPAVDNERTALDRLFIPARA